MKLGKVGPKRRRRTRRQLPEGQFTQRPKGPGYYQPNRERASKLAPKVDQDW